MSTKPPPVPPGSVSPKGTGSAPEPGQSDLARAPDRPSDPDGQGQVANTRQNVVVQGNAGRRQRSGDHGKRGAD